MPRKWQWVLAIILVVLSAALYAASFLFFREPKTTAFYIVQDLAFLQLNVLLVSFLLDRFISRREQEDMLRKLNMVIGVFFDEVGAGLIRQFSGFDEGFEALRRDLAITGTWTEKSYAQAKKKIGSFPFRINSRRGNLNELRNFLTQNRDFLLRLLENPNLLENESFTQLLWAVFHVEDELSFRTDLTRLSDPDANHLSGDIRRAYILLISEWLTYMNHLRTSFPYLYSLAVRMNPFNPDAGPEIRD